MKIKNINLYSKNYNNVEVRTTNQQQQKSNSSYVTLPNCYPSSYYLSFAGKKDIIDLYKNADNNGMPSTVRDTLASLEAKSPQAFNSWAYSSDMARFQKYVFSSLSECKTVDDVKKRFPDEKCFANIKKPTEYKDGPREEDKLFFEIANARRKGKKVLNVDEDVTTFFIKKIFLECKEYQEVITEFKDAIIIPEIKGMVESLNSRKIGAKFFEPTGLIVPNGVKYGLALRPGKGGPSVSTEELNESLVNYAGDKTKGQLVMIDAWNNCFQIRKTLSEFIFLNYNSFSYNPSQVDGFGDLVSIYENIDSKPSARKMKLIMIDFWEKYPEYRKEFSIAINDAESKYTIKKAQGEEEFAKYKKEIGEKRKIARAEIEKLRSTYHLPFKKAREIIQTLLETKIKPLYINDSSSIRDVLNLLLENSFTEKELNIIEGDLNQQYKSLVFGRDENSILGKVQSLMRNNSEYRSILNSQSIAIFEAILKNNKIPQDDLNLIIQDRSAFNDFIKRASRGESEIAIKGTNVIVYLSGELDLKKVSKNANANRKPLSEDSKEIVKSIFFETCSGLTEDEKDKLETFISKQPQFVLKIQSKNKNIKNIVMLTITSEFDRKNGTNVTQKLLNNLNSEKVEKFKLDYIDSSFEWDSIIANSWIAD